MKLVPVSAPDVLEDREIKPTKGRSSGYGSHVSDLPSRFLVLVLAGNGSRNSRRLLGLLPIGAHALTVSSLRVFSSQPRFYRLLFGVNFEVAHLDSTREVQGCRAGFGRTSVLFICRSNTYPF